jgi:CDP-glucose 4,6-dehydratase
MNVFHNKKVLITGHTGFKGSWLSAWLNLLGAEVTGLSNQVPTRPSHFEILTDIVRYDLRIDIRNQQEVSLALKNCEPDFIFHLAAQPIVFEAYENPFATFETNVMGTASVLEYLRNAKTECTAVFITSDKCYDNVESIYGYRESDRLGGKDPYSASKGGAEFVIKSYFDSYFSQSNSKIKMGVGRAGNVIGGGDWAPFRIVPDCARSWAAGKIPEIRNPFATRPWQHVLEPLSGYLSLAASLSGNSSLSGEAFNFGPSEVQNHSVEELVEEIMLSWSGNGWLDKSSTNKLPPEAGLLKLCCDKALHGLGWQSTLNFKETAKWTAEWYKAFYNEGKEVAKDYTLKQIDEFVNLSISRKTSPLFIS